MAISVILYFQLFTKRHKNVEGLTIMELEKAGYVRQVGNVHSLLLMKLRKEFPEADDGLIKGFIRRY